MVGRAQLIGQIKRERPFPLPDIFHQELIELAIVVGLIGHSDQADKYVLSWSLRIAIAPDEFSSRQRVRPSLEFSSHQAITTQHRQCQVRAMLA
jgi:hypothetical protein